MDYLNVQKTRRHHLVLMVGYVLIATAIVTGTLILVQLAYGFGLTKNGTVIQNGSVYFSSQPNPADIYISGKLNGHKTNTRLYLPGNVYQVKLSRNGYRDWQRTISLYGGSVEHFDYPLLFPTNLISKKIDQPYPSAPSLVTQSPDRRWLVVQEPGASLTFDVYDLANPAKAPVDTALPAGIASKATSTESWQVGEWADDNQHVLLQHDFDGKTEYI